MIETNFKHTDIGLIPHDWEIFTVASDCYVKARIGWQGLTTAEYLSSGDFGLITSTDLIDGEVNWGTCHFVSEDRYNQDTKIQVKEFDILVSKDGTIGKVGIVKHLPFPATLNSGVFVIRSNNKKQSQIGLSLAFISPYFKDFIRRLKAGSTIVHLYQKDLVNFIYPLPASQEEQERIAGALSEMDELIATMDEQIAKKRLIKQGAMQQLISGKTRLQGFTESWRTVSLGDVAGIYRGGSPRPIEAYLTNREDGINWIKIGDVGISAKYIEKTEEKIIREGISHSRQVYAGDFLLSNSMSFGRPYILKIDGCIHDGWLVIQDYQSCFEAEFLYYLLSSNEVMKQYRSLAAGSSVLNLNKDIVSKVQLTFPAALSEQRAIADTLSAMDEEIQALQEERDKYALVKQGMMQQLLTGKIRI